MFIDYAVAGFWGRWRATFGRNTVVIMSLLGAACGTDAPNAREAPATSAAAKELYERAAAASCSWDLGSPNARASRVITIARKVPCRLKFAVTAIRIGGDSAPNSPVPGRSVARNSKGIFFTNLEGDNSQIAVWRADGSLARLLGKAGSGPGEFPATAPQSVHVDAADRLHVRSTGGIWSTFDSNLNYIARRRIPASGAAGATTVLLADGSVLFSSPTHGAANYFKVSFGDERPPREFGPVPTNLKSSNAAFYSRGVALESDSTFWAGPASGSLDERELERWTVGGDLQLVLQRRDRWLEVARRRPEDADIITEGRVPVVSTRPMHVDPTGALIVYTWVPNAAWQWVEDAAERARINASAFNLHIDVIDPGTGAVLASEIVNAESLSSGTVPFAFIRGTRIGFVRVTQPDGRAHLNLIEYALTARQ